MAKYKVERLEVVQESGRDDKKDVGRRCECRNICILMVSACALL